MKSVRSQPARAPGTTIGLWLAGLAAAGLLAGCGATGPGAAPTSSAVPSPGSGTATADAGLSGSSPPSTATERSTAAERSGAKPEASQESQLPIGPTLRELGFQNGPLDDFSLPKGALAVAQVDQPNTVTFVLSEPSPAEVESYLRTTLVKNGFVINAQSETGQAMTFSGHGWRGAFTGTNSTSAIVLRPAAPR